MRLAMALEPDPELLVLDEPTGGMDVERAGRFWAAMRGGRRARPQTVVFATHYLEEADHLRRPGRRVVREGRVVADGGTASRARAP